MVLAKKEHHGVVRPRGVTIDDFITKYLEDEVKGKITFQAQTLNIVPTKNINRNLVTGVDDN